MRYVPVMAAAAIAACSPTPPDAPAGDDSAERADQTPDGAPSNGNDAAGPAPAPRRLIGEEMALAEWRKADNRATCAPLALASDAGGDGQVRRANFSGGWAVAFDRPGLRSAYGFAGAGMLPEDDDPHPARVAALDGQWPYLRRFGLGENLPEGSAAGYGVEGADPYPPTNADGRRLRSLAYLRIPGQACLYNVWSKLGRDHLEALLASLRIVEPGAPQ